LSRHLVCSSARIAETPLVLYLHVFRSGPLSTKAQFFRRKFAECGVAMEIPQLDEGDFERLTISGQLGVIERTVNGRAAILIGSSLGGYLAALWASRHPGVERLVLLAPAFQFPRRWRERFSPDELERWKIDGSRSFFHYGSKQDRPLGYGFVEDALLYEDQPDFRQPALVFHGTRDEVASCGATFCKNQTRWCRRRSPRGLRSSTRMSGCGCSSPDTNSPT
jgi:hypothetical protein